MFLAIALACLQACGAAKPPACSSSAVEEVLQSIFVNDAAAIFETYVVPRLDAFSLVSIGMNLEMGMQDDLKTVVFLNGQKERLRGSFRQPASVMKSVACVPAWE